MNKINITTRHIAGSCDVYITTRPIPSGPYPRQHDVMLRFPTPEDAEVAASRSAGLWSIVEAQVVLAVALKAAGSDTF